MSNTPDSTVVVHVDPSCPFAWITYRWLVEVERTGSIELDVRLLSLSVVNEDRKLDDWYRNFNDLAWAPARVMQSVLEQHGSVAARRFYEAFGQRFHVELDTGDDVDRRAVAIEALDAADLQAAVIEAADDHQWDVGMRTSTAATIERVGLDVGVPIIEINGTVMSGPVLSAIPRGPEAVGLFGAIRVLAENAAFIRLERQRIGSLHTA